MRYSVKSLTLFVFAFLLITCTRDVFSQQDTSKVRELIISAMDKNKPFQEVIKIADDAIILSDKIDYMQGKADALNLKGNASLKLGDYPEALNYFLEELKLRENNPNWKNSSIGNTYTMIGESYRAISSYNFSIDYLNKGLSINLNNKDEKEIAHSYNRLAAVYFEKSYRLKDTAKYILSEDFAKKCIDLSERINNSELTISSYNILGSVYYQQGNPDKALVHYFIALSEANKDTSYSDRPNILNNISNVYLNLGNYRKAIEYGLQSYELAKKSGIKVYIVVSARALSDSYSKIGDYKNAFDYLLEAHNLYLELYDERKTAEIYGLQKKHESELVESNENARTLRRITIGFALIIIVIVISVVIYLRHKQQVMLNKELESKNRLISDQKEELAQSNAAKDKFFSILSHDIRNPLNGMLGFSDLLDSEFYNLSDEEKKEYIGYIKSSSESLYKLIEKVLIWSRLQAKRIDIIKEKMNLYETLLHTTELQKANAVRKGIILENNVPGSINVFADKNIVDLVLRNLIDNAVKYTKSGGKVSVGSEVKGKLVTINVTDTGVGMKKSDLDNLFLIDRKISSPGTDREEGSGLGLILCKELLELMDSVLSVESEKGKGTRFFFNVPLAL